LIRSVLLKETASSHRVFVSFDFAYGYPADFAAALQAATGMSDKELPWLTMWHYLTQAIKDDEGTAPGGRLTNRSNRFEIDPPRCLVLSLGEGDETALQSWRRAS